MASEFKLDASGNLILNAAGEFVTECGGCAIEEDCSGECYRLAGYTDGDLTACDTCEDSDYNPWGGEFDLHPQACRWQSSILTGGLDGGSISGKRFANAQLEFFPVTCVWRLYVNCYLSFGNQPMIWLGYKSTGSTPAGDYTRDSGCDGTSTLTVEEC